MQPRYWMQALVCYLTVILKYFSFLPHESFKVPKIVRRNVFYAKFLYRSLRFAKTIEAIFAHLEGTSASNVILFLGQPVQTVEVLFRRNREFHESRRLQHFIHTIIQPSVLRNACERNSSSGASLLASWHLIFSWSVSMSALCTFQPVALWSNNQVRCEVLRT